MVPEHRGSFLALGALLTLTAVGSLGCCSARCENTAEIAEVSPTDTVVPDPIVISKQQRQEVLWRLPSGSTITYVAIALGGKPAPFERCRTVEGVCRITCESGLCASGPVGAAVDPPAEYGYVFERPVAQAALDPTIRIDP